MRGQGKRLKPTSIPTIFARTANKKHHPPPRDRSQPQQGAPTVTLLHYCVFVKRKLFCFRFYSVDPCAGGH